MERTELNKIYERITGNPASFVKNMTDEKLEDYIDEYNDDDTIYYSPVPVTDNRNVEDDDYELKPCVYTGGKFDFAE